MTRPRLLDLFCGGGGAGMGYHRAGFDVFGVDIHPQPNYPFPFEQMDVVDLMQSADSLGVVFGMDFHAAHASPPCQAYSTMSACRPGLADNYPELVDDMRRFLNATGLPWVIENVVGAPVAGADDLFGNHGVTLCGRMFGLPLYRHRLFETSMPIVAPPHPPHLIPASKAGHWKPGTIISVSGNCAPISRAREAMGIDWMNRDELAEAIPPAYTEFIGSQLLAQIGAHR